MNNARSNDIQITIGRTAHGEYAARLLAQDGAEATGVFIPPGDDPRELRAGLANTSNPRLAQQVGTRLFDALFNDKLGDLYRYSTESPGAEAQPHLLLTLEDPALATLPWELLYDQRRDQWLALAMGLLRYQPHPTPARPAVVGAPLRVLLTSAGLARADEVLRSVQQLLATLQPRIAVTVEHDLTRRDLQRLLRIGGYDIWHCIAGGTIGPDNQPYLTLDTEYADSDEVDVATLARLLRASDTRLVMLDAAETNTVAPFNALGLELLRAGCPAVVAPQFVISDEGASDFLAAFYRSLAQGEPLQEAAFAGRRAVAAGAAGRDAAEWAAPVVYTGMPGGIVFDFVEIEAARSGEADAPSNTSPATDQATASPADAAAASQHPQAAADPATASPSEAPSVSENQPTIEQLDDLRWRQQTRLRALELREASLGSDAPPDLIAQIDEARREIAQLDAARAAQRSASGTQSAAQRPDPTTAEERQHQLELLNTHRRRLRVLNNQQAALGVNAPAHILTDIEDARHEITRLEAGLRAAGIDPDTPAVEPTPASRYADRTSEQLAELRAAYQQRLDPLEANAAVQGIYTPPTIILEAEDTRREIAAIDAALAAAASQNTDRTGEAVAQNADAAIAAPTDAAAASLGIRIEDEQMHVLIPIGSAIPTRQVLRASASRHGKETCEVQVLRGEGLRADDNVLLGVLLIDLPPTGGVNLTISFELNTTDKLVVQVETPAATQTLHLNDVFGRAASAAPGPEAEAPPQSPTPANQPPARVQVSERVALHATPSVQITAIAPGSYEPESTVAGLQFSRFRTIEPPISFQLVETSPAVSGVSGPHPASLSYLAGPDQVYALLQVLDTPNGRLYDITLPNEAVNNELTFPINRVLDQSATEPPASNLQQAATLTPPVSRTLYLLGARFERSLAQILARTEPLAELWAARGAQFVQLDNDDAWNTLLPSGSRRRVLLFIPDLLEQGIGDWSSAIAMIAADYGALIEYRHPILTRSPLENARDLLERIPDDLQLTADIIGYGRGGLVARALTQLLPPSEKLMVGRVVLVGTPHSGLELAEPDLWDRLISLKLNAASWLGGINQAGPAARACEPLLRAAAQRHYDLAGLTALALGSDFLGELNSAPLPEPGFALVVGRYRPERVSQPFFRQAFDQHLLAAFGGNTASDLLVDQNGLVPASGEQIYSTDCDHFSYLRDQGVLAFIARQLASTRQAATDPAIASPSEAQSASQSAASDYTNYSAEQLADLRTTKRQRLNQLQQREQTLAQATPPEFILEIEDIEAELATIDAALHTAQQAASASQRPEAALPTQRLAPMRILASSSTKVPQTLYAVAFSPDGSMVAAGGENRRIGLWHAADGRQLGSQTTAVTVNGLAFAPDGQHVAAALNNVALMLWDPQAETPRIFSVSHDARATCIAYRRDGRQLAVGLSNGSIQLSEPRPVSLTEIESLRGHRDQVNAVAFSHNSQLLASAADDGTINLWNPLSGELVRTLSGHSNTVDSLALSTNGHLASASPDGSVRLWDAASGQLLRTLAHGSALSAVVFAPDGAMLASGGDPSIKLWRTSDGAELATLHGHTALVTGLAFAPDGQTLASVSADGTLRLWDVPAFLDAARDEDATLHLSYDLLLTVTPEELPVGAEAIVQIELWPAGATGGLGQTIELSPESAPGATLNLLLNAPGFQLQGGNAASLPIDQAAVAPPGTPLQRAAFHLTALRPGPGQIVAEVFAQAEFATTLSAAVKIDGVDEAALRRSRPTPTPRPVPQPDLRLEVRSAWDATRSTITFYYLLSAGGDISAAAEYPGATLPGSWPTQAARLLSSALADLHAAPPEDGRARLAAIGRYFWNQALPAELRDELSRPARPGRSLLILADQDAWLPWELLHDGRSFLGERYLVGRWPRELTASLPYEFPVGAISLGYFEGVSQPERWASLLQPTSAPAPRLLPGGLLDPHATDDLRGLHLLRQSMPTPSGPSDAPMRLSTAGTSDDLRPAKLNLRRHRPLVALSYLAAGQPVPTGLAHTWASAFVYAGSSALVGPLWSVRPEVEATFVSQFYQRLWQGANLGDAFAAARWLAHLAVRDSIDWMSYVLYGDPLARPYRPVPGQGYAIIEAIGRPIDAPLPRGTPARFRVSVRRAPPVWHTGRVVEVAEQLAFSNLEVHVISFGLAVAPAETIQMLRTPTGDYIGWFTLTLPDAYQAETAAIQIHYVDNMRPVHSLMFEITMI